MAAVEGKEEDVCSFAAQQTDLDGSVAACCSEGGAEAEGPLVAVPLVSPAGVLEAAEGLVNAAATAGVLEAAGVDWCLVDTGLDALPLV